MDAEKQKAKEKFLEIKSLFSRLGHEVSLVIESYYIWRTLTFARSIPEVGEEQANINAKLMTSAKYFFLPTEQSHLQTFVVGLMKFFDKKLPALSFISLINEISLNKTILTADIFRSVWPELENIGSIKDSYLPIDEDIIKEFERFIATHEVLISNLKDARDKQFAHIDIKPISVTFIPDEVEILIDEIQIMFNKLSNKFEQSTTIWSHLKDDSITNTEFLLKNFARGEAQRIDEIKNRREHL